MDWARSGHAIYDKLVAWFDLYKATMVEPGYIPGNTYNMDETGVMLSVMKTKKGLCATDDTRQYRGTPTDRELVTAVECISMDGFTLKPMIIMKAKSHRDAWYSHSGTQE
jgi:hypothetical protein